MNKIDKKLLEAFLILLKNKKQINVSSVARVAKVDRPSVYYRFKLLEDTIQTF
jgi:Mn-dependent DtxR family transcriptional regulator